MIAKYLSIFIATFALFGCETVTPAKVDCELPELPADKVIDIAERFAKTVLQEVFVINSEKRLEVFECEYAYTIAEKLDSFGEAYVFYIDRNGEIVIWGNDR